MSLLFHTINAIIAIGHHESYSIYPIRGVCDKKFGNSYVFSEIVLSATYKRPRDSANLSQTYQLTLAYCLIFCDFVVVSNFDLQASKHLIVILCAGNYLSRRVGLV